MSKKIGDMSVDELKKLAQKYDDSLDNPKNSRTVVENNILSPQKKREMEVADYIQKTGIGPGDSLVDRRMIYVNYIRQYKNAELEKCLPDYLFFKEFNKHHKSTTQKIRQNRTRVVYRINPGSIDTSFTASQGAIKSAQRYAKKIKDLYKKGQGIFDEESTGPEEIDTTIEGQSESVEKSTGETGTT